MKQDSVSPCVCEGIRRKSGVSAEQEIETHLEKMRSQKHSWNELYRCTHCGTYWEKSFPGAGDVCCVEPELQRLSKEAAAESYPA